MIQDKMFPVLEELLSWTSRRQQALAANVANMDTPGYRAKDYSFKEEMQSLAMTATSGNHIAPVEAASPRNGPSTIGAARDEIMAVIQWRSVDARTRGSRRQPRVASLRMGSAPNRGARYRRAR